MLLMDIGNTRIKWAYWHDGQLHRVRSEARQLRPLEQQLQQWFGDSDCSTGVFIGSVASAAFNEVLDNWFRHHCGQAPVFAVAIEKQAGVVNGYQDPRRLGVDRWAAMIAAHAECEGAVCVLDCGSAITLDIVSGEGVHQGGLIMPGLGLMQSSLVQAAAGIPEDKGDLVSLADNTADAVHSGCVRLAAAGLSQLYSSYAQMASAELHCIMTGGDAPLLAQHMGCDCHLDEDLVLRGLALMASS